MKQLNEGFKRPVYWRKYKVIGNKVVEIAAANAEKHTREWLDSSYQGVKRLLVLAYDNIAGDDQVSINSFKKYFLPSVKIGNNNIEVDGKKIYDQPIDNSIKQFDKVRKVSTGQGEDYTTGCLLDFAFFEKFVSWFKTILKNQESFIINGRKSTKYFKLERGARQGDPILAYLFILVLEIYLIFVNIKDLNIFKLEFLYTADADDTTFLSQRHKFYNIINEWVKYLFKFLRFKT